MDEIVGFAERTIRLRHVDASLQIHHGDVDAIARGHHDDPFAGQFLDVVRRTQQARLAREVIVNFALVPDMIAGGQDVEPVAEQILGQLRRDPESARGIFRVGDRQMNVFRRDDVFQMPRDEVPADGAENITDKKKVGQGVLLVAGTRSMTPAPQPSSRRRSGFEARQ